MATTSLRFKSVLEALWLAVIVGATMYVLWPISQVLSFGLAAAALLWAMIDPVRTRKPPLYRYEYVNEVVGDGSSARSRRGAEADTSREIDPDYPDDPDNPERTELDDDDALFTGSGFFIDEKGTFVTNYHLIESPDEELSDGVWMRYKGSDYPVEILAADPRRDLAICTTEIKGTAPAAMREDPEVRLGEKCIAAGFPREQDFTITDGMVSKLSGENSRAGVLQISAPVHPGSSGGPLIDRYGAVIGVVYGGIDKGAVYARTNHIPENVNFAVALSELTDFLDEEDVDYLVTDDSVHLREEEIAREAVRFTVSIYVTS